MAEMVSFEEGIRLESIGTDVYQSVQRPWTWWGTTTIPGGILMCLAAAAAFKTISPDFSLDSIQAHFLAAAAPDLPLQQRVQRVSDGGRFATRSVLVTQTGTNMVHVFCAFVRTAALTGPSMAHVGQRASSQTIREITLDDLELGRNQLGPYMKFQRLPLVYKGPDPRPERPPPESMVYTSAALIEPCLKTSSPQLQSLGIVLLSDFHVLDATPTLQGVPFGLPAIGDTTRTRTKNRIDRNATLNHSVHFYRHGGFRADDLCYIEVTNPWSGGRRGVMNSQIFDREGMLIATCTQEAYYVLKKETNGKL